MKQEAVSTQTAVRRCPNCGSRVAQSADTCYFCGYDLTKTPKSKRRITWVDLALVLAHTVMPTGRVYSYEIRDDMYRIAAENLAQVGMEEYVTLHRRDIADGFDQEDVDAVFLDVREPWQYLDQVEASLGSGGFFGALIPTTNQVSALIDAMQGGPWFDREVAETFVRNYKINARRLRPVDRMVAHTAYLIFARYVPRLQEQDEA